MFLCVVTNEEVICYVDGQKVEVRGLLQGGQRDEAQNLVE